ncbi:lysophospholipid acyltransferase family protein [Gephyromycinifex aptenodytis]|uniref:lysophospholipid acyltransferase family protein n=1 Tax=Gephyromycinifex aptenodytis TaxID=2716227 RepID=UPI001D032378|nr:lysophospholipid acyltransferase family protein [Gephyromycinifex aptenodytis]
MQASPPRAARPGAEQTWAYRSGIGTVQAIMSLLTAQDWQGLEHLPAPGTGAVICANHISYADPFAVAHMLHAAGHHPFFLAKNSLFTIPVIGAWIAASGQVPVYRGTSRAADAYRDAVATVQSGKTVVVMPESTFTEDPDLWPMRGKTGAARIAMATDRPIIPMAQWGPHELMAPDSYLLRPFPRKCMRMRVGGPVPLEDLRGHPIDRALLSEATARIMDAITAELEVLRGEPAPAERFDPLVGRRVPRRPSEEGGAA